jgi:ribosomal-protein-serine acetyltransferase
MFDEKINEHLSLRVNHRNFAKEIATLVVKNKEHLEPWMPWVESSLTEEGERNFLEMSATWWAQGKACHCVIVYDGKIVGSVGLNDIDAVAKKCEIGYWLDSDYTGRGIVTSAVKKIEEIAFTEYGIERVSIHADSRNLKSRAVAERLNYVYEGTMRRAITNTSAGDMGDEVIYSKLRSEWEAER